MEAPADGYNSNWFLTSNLKDYKDSPYQTIGFVSAVKTMTAGMAKDLKLLGSSLSGQNISGIDKDFEMIKRRCLAVIIQQAKDMGANGIIGIKINYKYLGKVQMVEIQGTAIKIGNEAIIGGKKKLTKKLRIKKAVRSQFPRRKQKKTRSKRR